MMKMYPVLGTSGKLSEKKSHENLYEKVFIYTIKTLKKYLIKVINQRENLHRTRIKKPGSFCETKSMNNFGYIF